VEPKEPDPHPPGDPFTPDAPPLGAERFDDRFDDLATLAYRVAFRIVGHREEARDIAQETLARAYGRWPRVRARAEGWVSRVATNLALDHVRRASRRNRGVVPAGRRGDETGSDHVVHAVERADLVAALRRLPRRQRDVVVLRYLADLGEAEVARTLDLSTGTVKSHAHRGLAALRSSLRLDVGAPPAPSPAPPDGGGPALTVAPAPMPNPSGGQ
jgi:RNA polymerase sigma-70 factor (sigma-E family)